MGKCKYKNKNLDRLWSELSYAGEKRVPQGITPGAGSWPLHYFKRNKHGKFIKLNGAEITFDILPPSNFDFDKELLIVQETLDTLTPSEKAKAGYWGDGPATKQWTPIIDILIDTYGLDPIRAARVLAAVHSGINDAFIITWHYKYLWDIPRPNQLDQHLYTEICTPKFPTYPSGHSVVAGTVEVILSYFFPPESDKLNKLAEENSQSRLYGGVHFPADLTEGLKLGRQIGSIIVDILKKEHDKNQCMVNRDITKYLDAKLVPPPYKQVIDYPPRARDCNLPLLDDYCKHTTLDIELDNED